jgi:hypothetical protein
VCWREPGRPLIVRQPELQQATEATEVAIDSGQILDLNEIEDAANLIAHTHVAQVGGDAQASGRRIALYCCLFVGQHGHAEVTTMLARCHLFLVIHRFSKPV